MKRLSAAAQRLLEVLPNGRDSALSRAQLRHLAGLDARLFRAAVAELRCAGVPVCFSQGVGFWLSDSAADLGETARLILTTAAGQRRPGLALLQLAAEAEERESGQVPISEELPNEDRAAQRAGRVGGAV